MIKHNQQNPNFQFAQSVEGSRQRYRWLADALGNSNPSARGSLGASDNRLHCLDQPNDAAGSDASGTPLPWNAYRSRHLAGRLMLHGMI